MGRGIYAPSTRRVQKGLAGLMDLRRSGVIGEHDQDGILLAGAQR